MSRVRPTDFSEAPKGVAGDGVDGINDAGPADHVDDFQVARQIPDAKPRDPVHLGKGPEDDQVGIVPDERNPVGVILRFDEFEVGLVDDHDLPPPDGVEKSGEGVPGPVGPRRVVGVAKKDHLRGAIDPFQHGAIVEPPFLQGNDPGLDAGKDGHPLVDGEGPVRRDDVVARLAEGLDHEGDDLVGAVSDDDLVGVDAVEGGKLTAQVVGIPAGINGAPGRREPPDDLLGARRRTQGGFGVVETDEAAAAIELLKLPVGFAGDVGLEFPDADGDKTVKVGFHGIEKPPGRPGRQRG